MKRILLFSFVFLLVGSVFIQFMAKDSGYVLISLGNSTFETSFWFAVFLLIVFIVCVFFIKKAIQKTVGSLFGSVGWIVARRDRHTMQATRSGLLNFLVGNWPVAKQELITSAKRADFPLVSYITAAQCARASGALEEYRFLLEQAKKQPEYRTWLLPLIEAQQFVREEQYSDGLKVLKPHLIELTDQYAGLSVIKEIYVKLGLWHELIELLPKMKSAKLFSDSAYKTFEENIYLSLLESQASAEQLSRKGKTEIEIDKNETQSTNLQLNAVWSKVVPRELKKRHRLVGGYAKLLHQTGEDALAESLIEQTLKSSWHSGLAELYGVLKGESPKKRLEIAEGWLKKHPNDARLLLTLGKICADNQLWGKAKSYFESSLAIDARPESYLVYAELLNANGDSTGSMRAYQQGLTISTR